MLLEGRFTLTIPMQKAWDFLLKPETLGSCLPGCEKMEAIDNKNYDSIVAAKVGPISARFQFKTTLVEVEPPRHLKAVGRDEDLNKNGTFSQETVVDLKEISKEVVEVAYKTNVSVVGRLATFGDRIMRAKAKQVEAEFTQALNSRLSGGDATVSELKVSIVEILATFIAVHWQKITRFFHSLSKGET